MIPETPKFHQVDPVLFPCDLSEKNTSLVNDAVQAAVDTWGPKSLMESEVEERLSYACEKVFGIQTRLSRMFHYLNDFDDLHLCLLN